MPSGSFLLGLLPYGAIMVGAELDVLETNSVADRILQDGDVLTIRQSRLSASSSAVHKALQNAIQDSLRNAYHAPVTFSVARSDRPPVSFAVLVVPRSTPNSKKKVLVLFSDPRSSRFPDQALLAEMFDFTPAETLIAAHLMRGEDVATIAEATRLSQFTVRNHLKRLFAKTKTSGQTDLVYTLLRSPMGSLLTD